MNSWECQDCTNPGTMIVTMTSQLDPKPIRLDGQYCPDHALSFAQLVVHPWSFDGDHYTTVNIAWAER